MEGEDSIVTVSDIDSQTASIGPCVRREWQERIGFANAAIERHLIAVRDGAADIAVIAGAQKTLSCVGLDNDGVRRRGSCHFTWPGVSKPVLDDYKRCSVVVDLQGEAPPQGRATRLNSIPRIASDIAAPADRTTVNETWSPSLTSLPVCQLTSEPPISVQSVIPAR
jgi:hypothetical protein